MLLVGSLIGMAKPLLARTKLEYILVVVEKPTTRATIHHKLRAGAFGSESLGGFIFVDVHKHLIAA